MEPGAQEPSTSNSILSMLYNAKKAPIDEEMKQLENETHPELLARWKKCQERHDREKELIDVTQQEELRRIDMLYKDSMKALEAEYEVQLNDLVEGIYNENEEKKRAVEMEINAMDITSTSTSNANYYYPNKKTLRRRANEQTDSGDKKPRKRSPQSIVHLLSEETIAEDMKLIFGNLNAAAVSAAVDDDARHRKVTVDNTRLVCDGKTFHKGQNVTVETLNYGKFPASIQNICDKFVQFRSTISGDTRQVTATKDDLESGRVVVRKRY